MMRQKLILRPVIALALAGLAACQPAEPAKTPEQLAVTAAGMSPADPKLADLYAHACKACHAVAGSGAPLTGDRAAWAPRVAKGLTALKASVAGGYKGMPAGGQCFTCTPSDHEALIRFMADQPVS